MDLPIKDEKTYLVETLTPKQDDPEFERKLRVFGDRYQKTLEHRAVMAIPDNPLGHLHFTALEVMEFLELQPQADSVLLHINTFHRKQDLDAQLRDAEERGIRYLLVVSGDGNERLPRLDPAEVGSRVKTVTSVELVTYIRKEYGDAFHLGVAFNYSEPEEHEMIKLGRKLGAGADFVITQPLISCDERVSRLVSTCPVPVFVGAWMSPKIDLIYECLGMRAPINTDAPPYSPESNLRRLHRNYPTAGVFLSRLALKSDWPALLPRLSAQ